LLYSLRRTAASLELGGRLYILEEIACKQTLKSTRKIKIHGTRSFKERDHDKHDKKLTETVKVTKSLLSYKKYIILNSKIKYTHRKRRRSRAPWV